MRQDVVIIGAPRSGTNMLRDVLTRIPGVGTWPCDEINYIWRHGNVRYASDEFTPDMARPHIQHHIRRQFERIARRNNLDTVVEKTCANSLRVEFVDRIVPETKYIFVRRDGLDAVGSAMKRWSAELDIPYLLRKVRFVPVADLPYYGSRYVWNHAYRLFSRERRLAFWGPQLDGFHELLQRYSLDEVCALQWKRCVDRAAGAFERMLPGRVVEVGYENFVHAPESELRRILDFIGLEVAAKNLNNIVADVSPASVGRGRRALGEQAADRLMPLMEDTMTRHGYA